MHELLINIIYDLTLQLFNVLKISIPILQSMITPQRLWKIFKGEDDIILD